MKLNPVEDRIIVKYEKEEEESVGILIIKGNDNKNQTRQGTIIAIGPGKPDKNGLVRHVKLEIDQRILYNVYGAIPLKHEGEEYIVLRETDVLAIIEQ